MTVVRRRDKIWWFDMSRCRWLTGAIGILSAALVFGGCGSSGPERTPRLTVVPHAGLLDRARSITISGLDPGEHVALDARTSIAGAVWASNTEYAADRDGMGDLSTAPPISGAYHGAWVMGPFWSESYQHGARRASEPANVTTLTATTGSGHSTSVTVTQSYRGPAVRGQRTTLARQGFVGEYFTPAGHRRGGPAMIVWGGSESGDAAVIPHAELLASHVISTLAIAYFDARAAVQPVEHPDRVLRKRSAGSDASPASTLTGFGRGASHVAAKRSDSSPRTGRGCCTGSSTSPPARSSTSPLTETALRPRCQPGRCEAAWPPTTPRAGPLG